MSAYNVLIATITCPNCYQQNEGKFQFRFGDTWQHCYKLGDIIKWGGYDIGKPNLPAVKAYGILESDYCTNCGYNLETEYDLLIQDDRIKGITVAQNIQDDNSDAEGNFCIANSSGVDI